jgi:imidazoleglycerol-phosphate dehydratase
MSQRIATVDRQTAETQITLTLNLDGSGESTGETGIGFFDHMLNLLARHGLLDIELSCKGDLEIDAHHTVEDVGICLGQAMMDALGDKSDIQRYGSAYVPMDECLGRAVVDLSGRSAFVWQAVIDAERVGEFPTELAEEFFGKVSAHAKMNLHLDLLRGGNAHHGIEALFKAFARAVKIAASTDPRMSGVPSTKGVL